MWAGAEPQWTMKDEGISSTPSDMFSHKLESADYINNNNKKSKPKKIENDKQDSLTLYIRKYRDYTIN